jgi:hypothetical protein
MPAELQLKEYLDNATESSKRIRTILIILVVVNVLILAGFLNSWRGFAWNSERIRFFQDYITELNLRINELQEVKEFQEFEDFQEVREQKVKEHQEIKELQRIKEFKGMELKAFKALKELTEVKPTTHLVLIEKLPPHFGAEVCAAANDQIKCYEGARWQTQQFLEESISAYVDNTYVIRVPFFGVAFDINDLGAIGGLSLIIILIMLRLNLRNFIVSLRIGFKAAREADMHPDFYDILAGRQVFAFPALGDPKQRPYEGRTESIWSESTVKTFYDLIIRVLTAIFYGIKSLSWGAFKVFLLSTKKEDSKRYDETKKNGWHSNPHPLLALVPTWICLVPAMVYAAVVFNDFSSYEIGFVVNGLRTKTSVVFSLVCLVVIFGLGCWCVSKWIEINELWKISSDSARMPCFFHHSEDLEVLKEESIRTGWLSFRTMVGLSVAIMVFAIVHKFGFGARYAETVPLVFGSIISIIASASYYVDIRQLVRGKNKRSLSFLIISLGMLTYLFTVYLFFFCGVTLLLTNIYHLSYLQILLSIGVVGFSVYTLRKFKTLTGIQRTLKRLVGGTSNLDIPNELQIKSTLNQWMQTEVPAEQVQTVGQIFSTTERECETIITSTNKWHWKATFRRSQEKRWYLATIIMCGREYEPNLEVQQE